VVEDGVQYVVQDLLEPLSHETTELMRSADRILHLAWERPGPATPSEAADRNAKILDQLLVNPEVGHRIVFVSSVAASPRAPGCYGRSKHAAQARVLALGGRVVVCGLIVSDPPETAFKRLVDLHRKLPVAFRLVPNRLRVYPVLKEDVVTFLAAFVRNESAAGAYRGFAAGGIPINDFLSWILDRYGLRRLRMPVPAFTIDAVTSVARVLHQDSLTEKLATFFFKDPAALEGLLDPPETILSASETEFSPLTGVRR
jgi:uncharacterized protein YbjT (DUF2867 family)